MSNRDINELTNQAELGDKNAQYALGRYYEYGYRTDWLDIEKINGVDMDIFWYQKAAEQGIKEAQDRIDFHKRKMYFVRKWLISELMKYKQHFSHSHKKLLFDLTKESFTYTQDNEITIARIRSKKFSDKTLSKKLKIKYVPQYFNYIPIVTQGNECIEWYLNFADGDLFLSYGTGLFAQDEIQVAEHPVLASIRHKLEVLSEDDTDYDPCTSDEENNPTPYLFYGVPRYLNIDISVNKEEGRPDGLYGNFFAKSSKDAINKATSVLNPQTFTNLIAMEAPRTSKGLYTKKQITSALFIAYTAFLGVKELTKILKLKPHKNLIHTGNWGTGSYGGNSELMCLIQLIAADFAQIETVYFHSLSDEYFIKAKNKYKRININKSTERIINNLVDYKFCWGCSDGN